MRRRVYGGGKSEATARGGTRMTSDIYYYGFYNERASIAPARVCYALHAIVTPCRSLDD